MGTSDTVASHHAGAASRSRSPPAYRQGRQPVTRKMLSSFHLFWLFLLGSMFLHIGCSVYYWRAIVVSPPPPRISHPVSSSLASLSEQRSSSRADGTFNGAPLTLATLPPTAATRTHCVGDNYHHAENGGSPSWMQRSCHFSGLFCYNVTSHRFLVYTTSSEQTLARLLTQGHGLGRHFHSSSMATDVAWNESQTVSLGGINQKWGTAGIQRLKWFPDVVNLTADDPVRRLVYALPSSVVLLPFHSLNGANPGHAVWDDFMSLYTLMDVFDLLDLQPLLMRFILDDGERGLWASCDLRDEKTKACAQIMNKFSPLMMRQSTGYHWSTTKEPDFRPEQQPPPTDLVCASHGAVGIGALTDHGVFKSHGWEEKDYETTHNHGRGGLVRRFRQYVMENVGLGHLAVVPRAAPHRVVVSQGSSSVPARNLKMEAEIALLRKHIPNALVEPYVFKDMSLTDQLRIAGETAVYITPCGGGAITGMFLPKGASIILFYISNGGVENNRGTGKPALLDWDLFSAMSHLRVHWIPTSTREAYIGQAGLVGLVRHELFLIESLEV